MVDRDTIAVYDSRADEWIAARSGRTLPTERFIAGLTNVDRPVADLGCGPGRYLGAFPAPTIALDASAAFLTRLPDRDPPALAVQADLEHLPFRRHALGAAWAAHSLVHVPRSHVPLALWDLHRALRPGGPTYLSLFGGDLEHGHLDDDDFAGRRFSLWPERLLAAVVEGAGFIDVTIERRHRGTDVVLVVTGRSAETLADTVGPGMKMLCVGLNPSPMSAQLGMGFARPGNRFWPAALRAGIVTRDRDSIDALVHHGIGMTDLVKRATRGAAELSTDEYRHGVERLTLLCEWLRPGAVCIIGLAGWRAAVDRKAVTGWQPGDLGGRPVYVMPNPSGLNAHDTVDTLAVHLAAAYAGPDDS
jgi:TDG/mug DNA glycosylase family protein